MHSELSYAPKSPRTVFFHCVTAPLPGHGGQTPICSMEKVLRNIHPDLRDSLTRRTVRYSRMFHDEKNLPDSQCIIAKVLVYNCPLNEWIPSNCTRSLFLMVFILSHNCRVGNPHFGASLKRKWRPKLPNLPWGLPRLLGLPKGTFES